MKHFGKWTAIAILACLAPLTAPAEAADPLPADNDFILRAPATEAAGIAARNGLTIVSQVATAVDEDGHSIYLVRAASSADPALVISDVEQFEPEAAGIERAVLASLPKLDQSAAMVLDTSAVESALGAIHGFDPPTAMVSAAWNAHLHDREIEIGKTAKLEFEFEQPASADLAAYGLDVDFNDGNSASYDPTSCVAVLEQSFEAHNQYGKWRLLNTSSNTLTLDSLAAAWPAANGDLVEVKLNGTVIYDTVLPAAAATIDSGWLDTLAKRQVPPGQSLDFRLRWVNNAGADATAYSLSVATAEGHEASYDPAGGPCVGHINELVTVTGNLVRFDLVNYGTSDLIVDSATLTWPAVNGKLMTARLNEESMLDAPYQDFGKYADGTDRSVWTGYLNQPATTMLELDAANSIFRGEATVAIIDTGIDPDHDILKDAIVPGYDFVNDVAGTASEWPDLDQSAAMVLDQSAAMVLDQSVAMVLDQSAAMVLDVNDIPAAFGHGTMVAGIIHRAAPEAKIMPLKAFDGNGHAHLYDIVDAIYFAVDNGANVINMSFNMQTYSPALMRAINYAARNGVACVASAGNLGDELLVFPASFGNTLGVASVDESGELSAFSNWGSDLVTISAPGENIVTTFPGNRFAVTSGTSFAAPWVAGGAAIFADKLGTKHAPGLADFYLSSQALSNADEVSGSGSGKSGHGRANLRKAVERVKSGRYTNTRPLGTYTISATFAEGCTANYPPPATPGACTVEGAGQLKFFDRKAFWDLTNESEIPITLDSISIAWEADNGGLKEVKIDGAKVMDVLQPGTNALIGAPWVGGAELRTLKPHQTVQVMFHFENNVVWTY